MSLPLPLNTVADAASVCMPLLCANSQPAHGASPLHACADLPRCRVVRCLLAAVLWARPLAPSPRRQAAANEQAAMKPMPSSLAACSCCMPRRGMLVLAAPPRRCRPRCWSPTGPPLQQLGEACVALPLAASCSRLGAAGTAATSFSPLQNARMTVHVKDVWMDGKLACLRMHWHNMQGLVLHVLMRLGGEKVGGARVLVLCCGKKMH